VVPLPRRGLFEGVALSIADIWQQYALLKRANSGLPERFHSAFADAMRDSPFQHHVTHHSIDEIQQMKHIHLSEDGKAGYLVKDHGDGRVEATGLFNQSGDRGRGRAMLSDAVKNHGVNYVEAYGPKLPKLYEEVGFKTHEKYPFDQELAHPDWDYERHGKPDYHIMHLDRGEQSE
jgi:hypothetical protein